MSAATLAEAEAILRSGASIDVVATDIGLGEELDGGLKIGQVATEQYPGIPILYVSGRPLTDGMKALFMDRTPSRQSRTRMNSSSGACPRC